MFEKVILRYEHMDFLLRSQCTGNAEAFARKLKISRKQIYNYISYFKEKGAVIVYDRNRETFKYEKPCRFEVKIEFKTLSDDECEQTGGGLFTMPFHGIFDKNLVKMG